MRESPVTKLDLNEAVDKLRTEIRDSQAQVRVEIRDLHAALIRWLIPLMLGQLAAMAALVKLL